MLKRREEQTSQPPSDDVTDDLMSAAKQYITQLQGPVGMALGQLRPVKKNVNALYKCHVYQQGPVQGQRGPHKIT